MSFRFRVRVFSKRTNTFRNSSLVKKRFSLSYSYTERIYFIYIYIYLYEITILRGCRETRAQRGRLNAVFRHSRTRVYRRERESVCVSSNVSVPVNRIASNKYTAGGYISRPEERDAGKFDRIYRLG